MDRITKVHALILRVSDYGEEDRMLTLLTKEAGILHAGAKGARKPKNRLFGVTDVFCLAEMILESRGQNLFVRQVSLMDSLYNLRVHPLAVAYAGFLCAVCEAAVPQQEEDEELYEAVLRAMFLLREGMEPKSVAVPLLMFLFRKGGFYPNLSGCVHCGDRDADRFSIEHGGLICARCSPYARRISEESLRCLRTCRDIADMPLPGVTVGAMELAGLYAAYHFEREFPSWNVIRRMDPSFAEAGRGSAGKE
ncbi:MAG: DNA repair protein RecO [Clostridia bacterium]|nr:DNA repair protein RecO [Clostridia bacterium]